MMANVLLSCQTIDNPDVVGGEYVLSSVAYGNGSIPLTVSGILNNCSDNATVYVALQLDNILDLNELTNINEVYISLFLFLSLAVSVSFFSLSLFLFAHTSSCVYMGVCVWPQSLS